MGARRRSLLGNKRTGASGTDEGSDLLGDGNTDEVPTPPAEPSPMEDPLTDPSASGPFMAGFLRQSVSESSDLLHAPVPPARSEPAPPVRSEVPEPQAQPTAPPVAPVSFDSAPTRAPTPAPPPSRALPEEGPPLVSFDQPVQPVQPAPTEDAWGEGWRPGSGGAPSSIADAPVARELFGGAGYEELEDIPPPTEELPSGVMEDVGQSYSTPYSVPEPPPIPGLVDRFTPPPVQRTELGDRKRKPDYLPDTPGGAANRGFEPTPAPVAKRKSSPRAEVDEGASSSGPPMLLLLGIGAAAVLGIGMVLLAAALFLGPSGEGGGTEGPGLAPAPGGTTVETRDDMRRKPAQLGTPEAQPVQPDPVVQPPPEPPAPEPGGTAPVPGPKPVPKPAVPTQPVPKPPPAADPKPAPAAAQGVLKIRANRRAMVYVNNQVVGFTPLDHKVAPGTWSVAAVLPGQPTTRQERNVSVSSAGGTSAVDFTF